jgi:hypothetical protein
MIYTKEQAQDIIREIDRLGYKINDYERMFLKSISRFNSLTKKQSEVLTKIYDKASGAGPFQSKQRF